MAEPVITLTILTDTFAEFARQARIAETIFPYIQIDVMDGQFVPNTSFAEREEINSLNLKLKFELHLMVERPLAEMRGWLGVNNVFRVIFPIEAKDNPDDCITFARQQGWEVGIVLNPNTLLTAVSPYLKKIDVLLFMTVYPGAQGAPFERKVLEKIKEFTKLSERPLCAVDGAVNPTTITDLKNAGVEIFNVGSFFTKAVDMQTAYNELRNLALST